MNQHFEGFLKRGKSGDAQAVRTTLTRRANGSGAAFVEHLARSAQARREQGTRPDARMTFRKRACSRTYERRSAPDPLYA